MILARSPSEGRVTLNTSLIPARLEGLETV